MEVMVPEGSSYTKKEVEVTLQGSGENDKEAKDNDKESAPDEEKPAPDEAPEVPEIEEETPEIQDEPQNFFDFFGDGNGFEQFFGNDGRF